MDGDSPTVGTFIEDGELPTSLADYRLPRYIRAGLGVVYERQVALLQKVGETRPATIEAAMLIDDEYRVIESPVPEIAPHDRRVPEEVPNQRADR